MCSKSALSVAALRAYSCAPGGGRPPHFQIVLMLEFVLLRDPEGRQNGPHPLVFWFVYFVYMYPIPPKTTLLNYTVLKLVHPVECLLHAHTQQRVPGSLHVHQQAAPTS